MTKFFPFFLDCSKQEVDKDRKKELENLAFGNALVITKGNKSVLLTDWRIRYTRWFLFNILEWT